MFALFAARKLHLLSLVLIHAVAGTALAAATVLLGAVAVRERFRRS